MSGFVPIPGRVPLLLAGAVALGCGNPAPPAGLELLARVRLMAEGLPPGWHVAEVSSIGGCLTLLMPQPPERPARLVPVPLDRVTELRVSSLYDGRPGPQGAPRVHSAGADTAGERWLRVDLESLRREHGECDPLGAP